MPVLEADPHPCLDIPGLPIGWDPRGEDGPGWYLLYDDVAGPISRRISHCPFCGAHLRSKVEAAEQEQELGVVYPRPRSAK